MNISYDRHATQKQFAEANYRLAEQVCCQSTDCDECDDTEDEANSRDMQWQVDVWIIGSRDARLDPSIDDLDETPHYIDGDRDWADDNETR